MIDFFKYDQATDGEQNFDIDKALNENWDKVDKKFKEVEDTLNSTSEVEEKLNDISGKILNNGTKIDGVHSSLNKGVIKSVQFVTGGASGGTTTVTFSPVDLSKTIFVLSDSVRNMDSYSPLYLKFRTTTSATIASGSTSTSGAFSLQVIEFN